MHETGTERRRVGGTEGRRDGGRGESLKVLHSRQFGSSAPPDRHPETFKHHYNEAVPSRKGASTRPPHLHVNNPRTEPPPLPPPLRLADRSISTARSLLVVLHLKNALFLHRAQSGGRYSHHHLRIRGWGKRENVGWRQVCVGRRIPGTIRGGKLGTVLYLSLHGSQVHFLPWQSHIFLVEICMNDSRSRGVG